MDYRLTGDEHACDVCRLLRDDSRAKPDARYCSICQAWLCDSCRGSMTQRAVAAILHAGEMLRGA